MLRKGDAVSEGEMSGARSFLGEESQARLYSVLSGLAGSTKKQDYFWLNIQNPEFVCLLVYLLEKAFNAFVDDSESTVCLFVCFVLVCQTKV